MPVGFSHIIPQNSHGYLKSVGLFFTTEIGILMLKTKGYLLIFQAQLWRQKAEWEQDFFMAKR